MLLAEYQNILNTHQLIENQLTT